MAKFPRRSNPEHSRCLLERPHGIVNAEKTLLRGLRNFMNSLFFGSMQKFAAKLHDRAIEPLKSCLKTRIKFQEVTRTWSIKVDTSGNSKLTPRAVDGMRMPGRFREQWLEDNQDTRRQVHSKETSSSACLFMEEHQCSNCR